MLPAKETISGKEDIFSTGLRCSEVMPFLDVNSTIWKVVKGMRMFLLDASIILEDNVCHNLKMWSQNLFLLGVQTRFI